MKTSGLYHLHIVRENDDGENCPEKTSKGRNGVSRQRRERIRIKYPTPRNFNEFESILQYLYSIVKWLVNTRRLEMFLHNPMDGNRLGFSLSVY